MIGDHQWSLLILNAAWPILMAYAGYKIALVFGHYERDRVRTEVVVAALGGVIAWWGRVLYSYPTVPLDWSFTLTVLGIALMVAPKLLDLAKRSEVPEF